MIEKYLKYLLFIANSLCFFKSKKYNMCNKTLIYNIQQHLSHDAWGSTVQSTHVCSGWRLQGVLECSTGKRSQKCLPLLHNWFWINFWLLCIQNPFTVSKYFVIPALSMWPSWSYDPRVWKSKLKLGVVTHALNLSIQEVESGRSL